jgi:MarR family 2-MHQ and catechol resistance regulon transcriptional repressor
MNYMEVEATLSNQHKDDELAYGKTGMDADLDTILVHNIIRTHSRIRPFIHGSLRRGKLTPAQLNTLLVLRAAEGKGLPMGEVGRRLVVTKSNVTGLVDRLQRQGLVVRARHRDRRATLVRLTRAGVRLLERTAPLQVGLSGYLAGCLTAQEKRALIRLLAKLRRELRLRQGGEA